jgi:hypothetical protein
MSLNCGSICRLCLTQTNLLEPLFTDNDIIPSRIMVLVPIIKVCELLISIFLWCVTCFPRLKVANVPILTVELNEVERVVNVQYEGI